SRAPPCRIRMVPACSTTNNRPVPSSVACRSTGLDRPATTGVSVTLLGGGGGGVAVVVVALPPPHAVRTRDSPSPAVSKTAECAFHMNRKLSQVESLRRSPLRRPFWRDGFPRGRVVSQYPRTAERRLGPCS